MTHSPPHTPCSSDSVQLFEAGRFADSEQRIEAALALIPGRPSTLVNLGATRIQLGKHAEALTALDALLDQHRNLDHAWLLHGQTLQSLERHEAALASNQQATAIAPGLGAAWSQIGQLLKNRGCTADAHDFLLRVSLRHAHSERCLGTQAAAHGFEVRSLQRAPLREQQRQPIEGLIVCMGRR